MRENGVGISWDWVLTASHFFPHHKHVLSPSQAALRRGMDAWGILMNEPLHGRAVAGVPRGGPQLLPSALLAPRPHTGLTPLAARWAAALHGESTLGAGLDGNATPPMRDASPPLLLGASPQSTLPPSFRPPPRRQRPVPVEQLLRTEPVRDGVERRRVEIGGGGGGDPLHHNRSHMQPRKTQPAATATQWYSPGAECNTPTAAAALHSLNSSRPPRGSGGGGGGAQGGQATQHHAQKTRPAVGGTQSSPRQALIPVQCASLRGMLHANVVPLRIQVPTGALLPPLDFERAAGVLSKKWRFTIKLIETGQPLGEWLETHGLGHLCSQRAPGGAHPAPQRRSYGYNRLSGGAYGTADLGGFMWPDEVDEAREAGGGVDDAAAGGGGIPSMEDHSSDEDYSARNTKRRRSSLLAPGQWGAAVTPDMATPTIRKATRGRSRGGAGAVRRGRGRGRGRGLRAERDAGQAGGGEPEGHMAAHRPAVRPGESTDMDSLEESGREIAGGVVESPQSWMGRAGGGAMGGEGQEERAGEQQA